MAIGASFTGVMVIVSVPVLSERLPSDTVYVMISVPKKLFAGV